MTTRSPEPTQPPYPRQTDVGLPAPRPAADRPNRGGGFRTDRRSVRREPPGSTSEDTPAYEDTSTAGADPTASEVADRGTRTSLGIRDAGRRRGTAPLGTRLAAPVNGSLSRHSVVVLTIAVPGFIVAILLHELPSPGRQVGNGLLIGSAALAVGVFLGFLFAVPRSATTSQSESSRSGGYAVNSNLEQISDWLTKILVGVTLIELANIGRFGTRLVRQVGYAFGGEVEGQVTAGAVLSAFGVVGFLLGYIETRTQLTKMFTRSDLEARLAAVTEQVDQIDERIEERIEERVDAELTGQQQRDTEAFQLTLRQLVDDHPVDVAELRQVLARASQPVQVQILLHAHRVRAETWNSPRDQAKHDRTIAIFRTFTEIFPQRHRCWANLGFALKDQATPDDTGALEALNMAIRLRGPVIGRGTAFYEYARAIVRSRLAGEHTGEAAQRLIRSDLAVALRNTEIRALLARAARLSGEDADQADRENQRLLEYLPEGDRQLLCGTSALQSPKGSP